MSETHARGGNLARRPQVASSPSSVATRGFVERSTSEKTRRAYQATVREFQSFLGRREIVDATHDDVRQWRDRLLKEGKRPATVTQKLSIVRSLYRYLQAGGYVARNPAATELVPPPALPDETAGRALDDKEVYYLLSGPDQSTPTGARDYALLLVLLRLGLRASEACGLSRSMVHRTKGRWAICVKVKGGRERTLPLPDDVKAAIDAYLQLDHRRRERAHSGGPDAFIFQPTVNYRTLEFARPITVMTCENIVKRWAAYGGIGHVSPHDLRRTAITKALDQGLTYRQVQMMSGHRDPKTVMRYDHGRENLDLNAVNFIAYESPKGPATR
jgi:integrase/recombinase XerD